VVCRALLGVFGVCVGGERRRQIPIEPSVRQFLAQPCGALDITPSLQKVKPNHPRRPHGGVKPGDETILPCRHISLIIPAHKVLKSWYTKKQMAFLAFRGCCISLKVEGIQRPDISIRFRIAYNYCFFSSFVSTMCRSGVGKL
jgi:hypothetical protein